MYTRHGHQIPGTTAEPERPQQVARCGGPGFCPACSMDAIPAITKELKKQQDIHTCLLCGLSMDVHSILTKEIMSQGLKALTHIGWLCPAR